MRWIRILNVRTVRFLILTAIIGAVIIYDYDYISQLHAYKNPSDDLDLLEDISLNINNQIQFSSAQQSPAVSRSQTASNRETVNDSEGSYVGVLEDIMAGELTPAYQVRSQSPQHINLGLILINLGQNTTQLSNKFTRKVNKGRISFVNKSRYEDL